MPGITYQRVLQWTTSGPRELYVITAPRPGGLYSLTPLLSNGTIQGRETVSAMERDVSPKMSTIGVNGDFFNWDGGWPSGLLMQDGVVEHQPADGRAAVGVDTSGTLHVDRVPWSASWLGANGIRVPIGRLNEPPAANSSALFTPVWGARTPALKGLMAVIEPFPPTTPLRDLTGTVVRVVSDSAVAIPRDGAVLVARGSATADLSAGAPVGSAITAHLGLRADWASVTDAVSAGPTLVKNGQPIANAGEALSSAQLNGRAPRTAIGQRADGTIVIVAADGRRPGWSVGISNWDLALALVRYGCVTGLALDSGGSTTVALNGTVLNRPSDPTGERPVSEALVVGYTGVYAPAPAPTLSPNGDGVDDSESFSYKLVRPSTVDVTLTTTDGSSIVLDSGEKAPGTYRLSWDGTVNGEPAPEGRYRWNVSATDDLGRVSAMARAFTLDDTLGFLRLSTAARRISFALTRPASVRVAIETLGGEILKTAANGPRQAGLATVRWNGLDGRHKRVQRGTYEVRVVATSPVGLSRLTRVFRVVR